MDFKQFDVVKVTKKTRSRSNLNKAEVGVSYLVTSIYESPQYGTIKLYLVDSEGKEYFTTDKCVNKLFHLRKNPGEDWDPIIQKKWVRAKKIWAEKNYMAVVLTHFYNSQGLPYVQTRDGSAFLVASVFNLNKKFWLNTKHIHDDDLNHFKRPPGEVNNKNSGEASGAVSVRIPVWLAKKNVLK